MWGVILMVAILLILTAIGLDVSQYLDLQRRLKKEREEKQC